MDTNMWTELFDYFAPLVLLAAALFWFGKILEIWISEARARRMNAENEKKYLEEENGD